MLEVEAEIEVKVEVKVEMIKTFRDMDAWKKASDLSIQVFHISSSLPKSEDYALTSQLRRASNSVSANIAEAFGRKTKKDKQYFYTISRGSAFETQNHLVYGYRINYFNKQATTKLIEQYDDLIYQLKQNYEEFRLRLNFLTLPQLSLNSAIILK